MQSFSSSMNIEMWFSEKLVETMPEPEPVIDRLEVARHRVSRLHDELTALDHEFRTFKTKHNITASKFGVLLRVQCSFEERPRIEAAWRDMLKCRDKAVSAWHEALHAWATEKERAQVKNETPS
jgi:hypothetical protein